MYYLLTFGRVGSRPFFAATNEFHLYFRYDISKAKLLKNYTFYSRKKLS